MDRLAVLIACLVLALPAFAAGPRDDTHSFTLENGLEVVVIEDHRAPVVTQMVWYKVGSADEPPGRSGIAHFLEHLMFKATDELDDGEFSRIVAANGGEDNAFTSLDYTAYVQQIAADRLDLVMGMEADRMTDLDPGAAALLAERDVVLEERRQVVESSPGGPFGEAGSATLYLNSPYGRPVIGWPEEIAQLDYDAAMTFYQNHYAPNNAVLVVAGDVEPAAVEALARKHFAAIPASDAVTARARPQEPEHRAARRLEVTDARVSEPHMVRSYLAPQRRTGEQKEAAALVVLAELLGGSGITSTLARELQIGEGVALSVSASYSGTALDATSFDLYLMPRPDVALAEAEAALDAALARFVAAGPDPAALERIKTQVRASEIYALDNLGARARRVGSALTTGLTLDDVRDWPEILQELTAEDVRVAAEAVFRPEASVTGWLLPDPAGEGLGQ